MSKICVSIMVEDLDDELVDELKRITEIDLIEIRVDHPKLIEKALYYSDSFRERLIFTIRTTDEGGKFTGNEKLLLSSYAELIEARPKYIDIGVLTGAYNDVIDLAKSVKVNVIGSYHDPRSTPPPAKIMKIYNLIEQSEVDIVKIVTYANNYADNLVILDFLSRQTHRKPITAFCMGNKGRISRIIAPLLGSHITYVAINKNKTAPGQLTLGEYLEIMRLIK